MKLRGLDVHPDLVGVGFVLDDCHRMLRQFRVEGGKLIGQSFEFSEEAARGETHLTRVLPSSRFLVWLRPVLDPQADLEADRIRLTASGRAEGASRIAAFLRQEELLPPR